MTVNIEGSPVHVSIDSSATANTIDYTTHESINAITNSSLKSANVRLCPYAKDNPTPIPLAGSLIGLITTPLRQMDVTRFFVLKTQKANCLSSQPGLECYIFAV